MHLRPLVRYALVALLISLAAAGAEAQNSPITDDAPKGTHPVRIDVSHFAAMRDGVNLSAELYFPADLTAPLPTVLIRTAYNKKTFLLDEGVVRWLVGHGYAVVVQDVRGKYEFDGEFTTSASDRNDGDDTMSWIAAQP